MKTINLQYLGEVELTPERRRRIEQALRETQAILVKELSYPKDLQHTDAIKTYRNHITKLEGYLA